ncbi:archaellar assembly protein FlaJ [Thermococcus radiotolerans]|uniref:Flagellar assembly protein FlaJ n=1 Tax=Thermococcus radiotolerans TaxID=187880 RepID=A0A2Z2N2H6_9EURY|nr:archaellar assembly protein FlaJ [Thermococcus radiotolerans]ASJ13792.1 flagellar assembly protein FlaJ [Thermococcus radiotolerans]
MAGEKAGVLAQSGITMHEYFRKILLPSLVGAMALFAAVSVLKRFVALSSVITLALYAIPLLPLIYAVGYPYARISNKRVQINSKIPFFATYFAVLSTSDVSRSELIWNLATEKILEPIASDMKKVYYLIAKLHRGMPEALRFLARRTPSKVFADFLDRLAYSLDSGVELRDYLLQEQKTVMDDYETFYEGTLYDLDVFKEVYSSLIISVVFMVTFIIIGPILTGQDIVSLSAFMFVLVLATEIGIMLVIKYRMPEDKIWADYAMTSERKAKFIKAALVSVAGIVVAAVLVALVVRPRFDLPLLVQVAIVLTPLMYLGKVLEKEEKAILVKDENFPAFMRSLSSSLAASGAALPLVLKYLSAHDFGVLTQDIRNLYRRVSMRIDNSKSWRYFTIDTGSWLIGIFSEIFNKSINLGAEPDYVGMVISRNFERLVRLRRKRAQTVASFRGVIYGITGAFAFSVAAAFQVSVYMNKLFSNLTIQGDFLQNIIFVPSKSGLEMTDYILMVILIIHCLLSALSIKFADGGHIGITVYYFVVLVWLAALGQYLGTVVMGKMMTFSSLTGVVIGSLGVIP